MSNHNDSALKFILEFGRAERRGQIWVPKFQGNAVEKSLRNAGYLTAVEDDSAGLPMILYTFTKKAWDLYRSLEELDILSKGAESPAQSYPVERCIG